MIAFVYLKDKDAFQRWNSKFLARRLIYGTSVSDDGEASLISRLKEACGSDYTTSFQRMFQDISVSRDLNTDFQDHLSHVVSSYRSGALSTVCIGPDRRADTAAHQSIFMCSS